MFVSLILIVVLFMPYLSFGQGFCAGTLVKIPGGIYKSIEKINPGDSVITFDGINNAVPSKVKAVCFEDVDQLVKLKVNDEIILVGLEHKFFSLEAEKWILAKNITSTTKLLRIMADSDPGQSVIVEDIGIQEVEIINQCARIYCMDVEDNPNFCVSSSNLVVHNEDFLPDVSGLIYSGLSFIKSFFASDEPSLITNSPLSSNKMVSIFSLNNNVVKYEMASYIPVAIGFIGGALLCLATFKLVSDHLSSKKHSDNHTRSNFNDDGPSRSVPGFTDKSNETKNNNCRFLNNCDEKKIWRDGENNVLQARRGTENQYEKILSFNNENIAEMFFVEGHSDDLVCIKIRDSNIIHKIKEAEAKRNSDRGFFDDLSAGFKEITHPFRKLLNHQAAAVLMVCGLGLSGNIVPAMIVGGKKIHEVFNEGSMLPINTPPPIEYGIYEQVGENLGMFIDDSGRLWIRHKDSCGSWSAFNNAGQRLMEVDALCNCKKFNI